MVDDEPINSVQVSHPTFADLSGALDIDGPRGKYMLVENVVQPVWRRKDAMFLYIDSDSVPATYNEQFQMALQRVWSGIDSSKIFVWTYFEDFLEISFNFNWYGYPVLLLIY